MSETRPPMALNDFKNQLDSLSESLQHFDPVERSKALEILQECIQGLESKNNFSLTEDLNEEILNSMDVATENNQDDHIFITANEKKCSENDPPVGKTDLYEKRKNVTSTTSQSTCEYAVVKDCSQDGNTPIEKNEDEVLEYIIQSDEECESQSEEDWKSMLKCPKCEEKYDNKSSFLDHLQLHSGKVKSCIDCHKEFQNSITFKFHKQLEMCVKSNKMYKCKLCNKTLCGGSQYKTHVSAHKRNQCKTCGDHFAKRKHLEAHTVNVHNTPLSKDLFRCHLCERTFTQRRSLVYHYKITHPDSDVFCSICLEMFDSSAQLEAHQATHKQQIFICEKCNEQFSRKQQFLVHMKGHERYKCATCNEGFSAKKVAIKHAKQGHEVSGLEPQLQCAQCGQMFCTRALLNSHMILHTGGKTLACEKCKVTFRHERNYRSHLETNEHLRGEEPKNLLACEECNKTFTNKNNLRVHRSRMHKADMKEHTCPHCCYKTKVLNNFKRHIALHTEKPQFICDKCGLQLQTKSALQDHHLRLHYNSKEFSCDKCGKMFGGLSDLNRHLLHTHSDTSLHTCHCGNGYKTLSNLKRHQLISHGKVDSKQKRLKKFFLLENSDPPKKKVKKLKKEVESTSTNENGLQLLKSQIPTMASAIGETNDVVMITETHQEELLEEPYNMDFSSEDKSHVVYTENLDMGGLHVVESMIQLNSDPAKQGTSVLINVRNLFGRPLTNEYIIPSPIESSLVSNLDDSLTDATQHITVTNQKQDVISGLQDYIIPHELNFLNVV